MNSIRENSMPWSFRMRGNEVDQLPMEGKGLKR
jgi:hypothetical protein